MLKLVLAGTKSFTFKNPSMVKSLCSLSTISSVKTHSHYFCLTLTVNMFHKFIITNEVF